MATVYQKQTLANVLEIITDKLDEAKDFLEEMEKTKSNEKSFRRRLSAFLSAADSMTEIMGKQGKRYARQIGKDAVFQKWFAEKQDLFRTPHDAKPKKGRNIGIDATWVYLRAARHETVHIQQIGVYVQLEFKSNVRLVVNEDKSVRYEFEHGDGSVEKFEFAKGEQLPPIPFQLMVNNDTPFSLANSDGYIEKIESNQDQQLPMAKALVTDNVLWAFKPLTIIGQGGKEIEELEAPKLDVITVCKMHIDTLEHLIAECSTVLK